MATTTSRGRRGLGTVATAACGLLLAPALTLAGASAATAATARPSPPATVLAYPGDGSLQVAWSTPQDTGGSPVTGFRASAWTTRTGGSAPVASCQAAATPCTISGLRNGASYWVEVSARNRAGDGPASTPRVEGRPALQHAGTVKPPPPVLSPPPAPVAVRVTGGDGTLSVAWSGPGSHTARAWTTATGGSAPGATCRTETASTCVLTGLVNGTTYYVDVVAGNILGDGPPSTPRVAERPRAEPVTPPAAPTSVTVAASNGRLTVTWLAPTESGGSTVTGYTATAWSSDASTADAVARCTSAGSPLRCAIFPLTNGTTYYVDVVARNGTGAGKPSTPRVAMAPAPTRDEPAAPVRVRLTAATNSLHVSWQAPPETGGPAISGYEARAWTSLTGGTKPRAACSTARATSCSLDRLDGGRTYYVDVLARNSVGAGPASHPRVAGVPLGRPVASGPSDPSPKPPDDPLPPVKPLPPKPPTALVVRPGDRQLTAAWAAAPTSSAAPVTGYRARAWTTPTGGSSPAASCVTTTARSCVLRSLTNGVRYHVDVVATNSAGASKATARVAATPAAASPPATWRQISAGTTHTCAVSSAGAAYCWGSNDFGQLGTGGTTSSAVPVRVSGLTSGVVAVSAGTWHSCALTAAGAVLCWGRSDYGQVGNPTDSTRPVVVTGLGGEAAAVSTGWEHSCALTRAGAAFCWGRNDSGQLGNGTHSTEPSPVPTLVTGLSSGVASISAGWGHTCAVTSQGAALCWGLNLGALGAGELDSYVPVEVTGLGTGVASISAGYEESCAVTTAGAAMCWGIDEHGSLGAGGSGQAWTPVTVTGLGSQARTISVGWLHVCATTTDGAARCWGYNSNGQLGDGTTSDASTPAAVTGLSSGVVAVSAGEGNSCAVSADGTARCWGLNSEGSLGNGTLTASPVPVEVRRP